jgi:GntR family transcriptional repressor for pyruvate dehydrogenase complex
LYEARFLIEPGIAEIAATRARAEDIVSLRSFVESGTNAHERLEPSSSVGRNFHYLLSRATGNSLLVMLMSSLLSLADAAPVRLKAASAHNRHQAHERIVEAIERRDGKAARQAAAEHLGQIIDEFDRALQP